MPCRNNVLLAVAAILLAAPAGVGLAHHPLDEVFDRNSSITLTGRIRQTHWQNPHVTLNLNVENSDGTISGWLVEMDPPHVLTQRGWTEHAVRVGQTITVEGFRSLSGESRTEARTITLEDGSSMIASTEASWNWRTVDASLPGDVSTPGADPATPVQLTPTRLAPPIYPPRAAMERIEGWVTLEFTVNDKGRTRDIEIVESTSPLFDSAARQAVSAYRYEPLIVDGEPVSAPGQRVTVRFGLAD